MTKIHTLQNIKHIFLAILPIKLLALMINLVNQLFLTEEKMWFINLLKQLLKSMIIVKNDKKHFNKDLVVYESDQQICQLNNKCWICDKLLDVGDNKVIDHCQGTGEYRDSAHRSCNINRKLTKNVSVILFNIKSYDSHLIIRGIGQLK